MKSIAHHHPGIARQFEKIDEHSRRVKQERQAAESQSFASKLDHHALQKEDNAIKMESYFLMQSM